MIYLASQSPRRQELLAQLGVRFETINVTVHEQLQVGESPEQYVNRVAREKAGAGLLQLGGQAQAVVLGADTDVVIDGNVLGKPADADQAAALLRRLSGRTHQVHTAVWLVSSGRECSATVSTDVCFAELTDREIADYIATGEPFGKAGAYAIQGRAAAFIAGITGSYSGVMGLPLHETSILLRNFGIPLWSA
ncbi:Maf family protein [Arenimonas sp.]|jgi:septum formation protein|uniref:Maf family protein n=1 Tax=Arenimonas sp. TaxID=1872635 RepID=UPI0037BF4E5E